MSASGTDRGNPGAAVPLLAGLTARVDRCAAWVCIALFVVILLTMILQVGFRYVLNAPLVWTEELARMCFIWACFLGAPVAMRRGTHVAILFAAERLPAAALRIVHPLLQGVAILFLLQLAVQGAYLTVRSHSLEMITLPLPWSAVYLAVPVSATLMILESARTLWLGPIRPDGEGAP